MVLEKLKKAFINTFGGNKLNSSNSEVRKRAVQALPVRDQDSLGRIAINDTDETIRCIAVNKLNDLDLLQTILLKCSSDIVKKTTQTRLFQLLCGIKHPIPDYSIRKEIIHGSRYSVLLEFVAANADQAALREMAIGRVSRDPLLGDIALSDDNPKVRQLAAQQITKRSTLERVVKASRRKDKRVYKIVKSKLDIIVNDEERPLLLAKEVLEICDKLEKLHKRNRLKQEKTTFDNYVKRWAEISNFANDKISQRYIDIKLKITNIFKVLEDELNKNDELILVLEKLLNKLSNAVDEVLIEQEKTQEKSQQETLSITNKEALGDKEKNILKLGRKWDEKIQLLQDQELIDRYNSRFFAILELSESKSSDETTSNDTTHLEKIKTLISQADSISKSSNFILKKAISTLQEKFNQHSENSSLAIDELNIFKQKFSSLCEIINNKLKLQQDNAEELKQQISSDIEQIKAQIKIGMTSKAANLLQSIIKKIDTSHNLSQYEKNDYHNDFKTLQLELGELSSWKSWAHDHERENLRHRAENIFSQAKESNNLASEYKDITSQIKELRRQWKKMHSHTADNLWQKFNNACNACYELCIPFIEQQEQDRSNNLIQKESLCEQLENYIHAMGWVAKDNNEAAEHSETKNTDWIQVDKITRQARKEWKSIGFFDRKAHKKINQRFENAMQIIRDELHKGWEINQQLFEQLISKVEALHESIENDLDGVINQAKKYQQQWKQIGSVSPYQHNKVWKKFRAACDIIFDKKQESIDEKNSRNDELIREKEAICENLEALNLQPLNKKDLEITFSDIKQIWSDLHSQSKLLGKSLNQRFSLAEKEYFKKLNQLLAQEQLEILEKIKEKAQICTHVEAQTTMKKDEFVLFFEQINQQWQEVKGLSNSIESDLNTRFKCALDTLQSETSIEQINILKEQELEHKQSFCLKYEIITGKDSPADNEQARMQMQVELLNTNMGQNKQVPVFEIQLEWYKLSNYTQSNKLQERFKQLLL